MKKLIGLICVLALLAPMCLFRVCVWGSEADADAQEIYFDVSGLEEEEILQKYEEQFEGADILLVIKEADMDYIPLLKQFHFHSLQIRIEFEEPEPGAEEQNETADGVSENQEEEPSEPETQNGEEPSTPASDESMKTGEESGAPASDESMKTMVITRQDTGEPDDPDNPDRKLPAESVTDISGWLTDEIREQIFLSLNDAVYRRTYNTLRTVQDLTGGSKGDVVLGVQRTLIDLGQDIDADSVLGNASFSALNRVLNALGIDKTNRISSGIYASLLPVLLMNTEEEAARQLFEDTFSDWEKAYAYMQGCLLYSQESNYAAKNAFEESQLADFEERAKGCVLDTPETGVYYRNTADSGNDASLTVQVFAQDEAADSCLMIYNEDREPAACLIVRGSGKASVNLKEGRYSILCGTGSDWFGMKDMFGEEGDYEEIIFDDASKELELTAGYDYSILFNASEHSDAAIGLGSEDIDWQDLEKQ